MIWPALALLLLAGGALSAPTHALVPGDDGPPSVLRTNDAQHPRQHTAISALLPNDHERRRRVHFFCKKTRYHYNRKRVGVFGGVWRQGEADSEHGIRFRLAFKWTRWYKPARVYGAEFGKVAIDIPGSGNSPTRPDYWVLTMDRLKYTKTRAYALSEEVERVLRDSIEQL